jgi:uncharacterized protein YecE (DUF72 family)
MENNMKIRIGTSGWSYEHWDKAFYGETPASKRLPYYARHFDTVEINTTFYHLPTIKAVKNWAGEVPKSFIFSVKASRFITHVKRLKDCKESLDLFYRQIRHLGKKLGPILFQLPPSMKKDPERLKNFIKLLKPKHKYVFEFRSPTWYDEEIFSILRKNKIAFCISDLDGKLSPLEITADFVYIRLHGPKSAYRGSYGKRRLTTWTKRIAGWPHEKNIYVYFDNDEKGYAIRDAITLLSLLQK